MSKALGEFEQLLLFALLKSGDGASSVDLRRAIEQRTGKVVTAGAVYTALDRLEGRSMVSSWLADATEERGGRRTKRYALEAEGAASLERSYRTLRQMARGLEAKLAEQSARGAR